MKVLIAGSSNVRHLSAPVQKAMLQQQYPAASIDVICLPGGRIDGLRRRLLSIDLQPYSVILCLVGGNDYFSKEGDTIDTDVAGHLQTCINHVQSAASPRCHVRFSAVLPRNPFAPKLRVDPVVCEKQTQAAYQTNGRIYKDLVPMPDFFISRRKPNPTLLGPDGVHLNHEGMRVWAETMVASL